MEEDEDPSTHKEDEQNAYSDEEFGGASLSLQKFSVQQHKVDTQDALLCDGEGAED